MMTRLDLVERQLAAALLAGGATAPQLTAPTGRGAGAAVPYVPRKDKYCYVHGMCEHTSSECKFMRSGKPNPKTRAPFTNAMKVAASFAAVPGGNSN